MLFCDIDILDENFQYLSHRWVGVKDGIIAYIGDAPPQEPDDFGEVYQGSNRLLMPAMYNAHTHAAMTLLRGYAENAPLQSWLNDLVWPFEAKMTPEDNYWAVLLACAEMTRYGTVGYTDMYTNTPERVAATCEAGIKANLSLGTMLFEPKPFSEYDVYQSVVDDFKKYNGYDDGRIAIEHCIHAEYTSNPITVKDIADMCKDLNMRLQVHVSETQSEHEECKSRHDGMTPFAYFDSLGVLDVEVIAAHCVWIEDSDIDIMVKRGVYAVNNPASNMKLGSGFAPVKKMLDAGVNVCLGTDGMASNNNHDIFQDMYLMALLSKGYDLDPTAVSPKQALMSATRMGALAQGRDDCGLVKEGFKADLCVVDTSSPSWTPQQDVLCNVVYAGHGSDVVLTLCDGRVVYREGQWPGVDVEKAKAEVSSRAARIAAEV